MRFLLALATLIACDAGGRSSPSADKPARVAVTPPNVVAPPAPAVEASVPLSSLVRPILPLEPTRRATTNPYLDDALTTASHGSTNDPAQVVSGVLAVAADPSSVPARFVEACLLAQVGEHALARAVIEEIRVAPGCTMCNDALLELRNANCGFDDETKRIADGVTPSPMRAAVTAVLASLNSGDTAGIAPYLDGTITMWSTCSVCDEPLVHDTRYSPAAFKELVRDADKRSADARVFSAPVFLFCEGQCCSGPTGFLNHSASFVTEVCFRGGAHAPRLATISTLDG